MTRRNLFSIVLPAFVLAVVAGCGGGRRSETAATSIVTTFLPVQRFTLDLVHGLNDVQVNSIAPSGGGCPHHYSLTPGDLNAVHHADVIVSHGLGIDPFLSPQTLQERKKGARWVELARALGPDTSLWLHELPTTVEHGHDEHGEEHGDHGEEAIPHAWASPERAAAEVSLLGETLAEAIPAHSDTILDRANRMTSRLDTLAIQFRALVDSASNKRIVAMHTSFDVLARDIGLDVVEVIQVDPTVPPGPRDLARILKIVANGDVAAVITEPQFRPDLAATISRETGVPVFSLDPGVTGTPAPGVFLQIQEENLRTLRRALGVHP